MTWFEARFFHIPAADLKDSESQIEITLISPTPRREQLVRGDQAEMIWIQFMENSFASCSAHAIISMSVENNIIDGGRNTMDKKKRIKLARAMDLIVRSLNDEDIIETWLMLGVADEDYKLPDEEWEIYVEDDNDFKDLITLFRKLVNKSEIYCDGICSD